MNILKRMAANILEDTRKSVEFNKIMLEDGKRVLATIPEGTEEYNNLKNELNRFEVNTLKVEKDLIKAGF